VATLEKLANRGAPPGNDTKLVNGVTPLANGKIGQRSVTARCFEASAPGSVAFLPGTRHDATQDNSTSGRLAIRTYHYHSQVSALVQALQRRAEGTLQTESIVVLSSATMGNHFIRQTPELPSSLRWRVTSKATSLYIHGLACYNLTFQSATS